MAPNFDSEEDMKDLVAANARENTLTTVPIIAEAILTC